MRRSSAVQNRVTPVVSAKVLLRELIDYAGLFPPASLSMAQAVANYEAYLASNWKWILGRFIVPAARLNEFEEVFRVSTAAAPKHGVWHLSALLGTEPAADALRVREFNMRMKESDSGRRALVDAVEVKVGAAEVITRLSEVITNLTAYFEIPTLGCEASLAVLAVRGYRAKLRTGGETADKFPLPETILEFIRSCSAANVPFKATAGLHHPLRSTHRFTYQPDSPSGVMHGFLNVFLAATFVRAGMGTDLAVQLLNEQLPEAIRFDDEGVSWREHRVSQQQIDDARHDLAISFGSCSFTEPIEDLSALHLL